MGYSEVHCRLCGVSFNIGRIRRADEPRGDGWLSSPGRVDFASAAGWSDRRKETDCQWVKRKSGSLDTNPNKEEEEEGDLDYVDEESSDEPLEFDSDDDTASAAGEALGDNDTEMADVSDEEDDGEAWRRYLIGKPHAEQEEFLPLDCVPFKDGDWKNLWRSERYVYEHIAGPSCKDDRGYNGHHVTVEEMRGCDVLQCLVRKVGRWQPEHDDLDFERQSNSFLTGLGDFMPSRDIGFPRVIPVRHGVEVPSADSIFWGHMERNELAMPFHPTCLDIFTRLSRLHFGHIDINGLMGWRDIEGSYDEVRGFPRHIDVKRSSEQQWSHITGLEYLASNPLFVPCLVPLLNSAISKDSHFDAQSGAFALPYVSYSHHQAIPSANIASSVPEGDIFQTLPSELNMEIVNYLNSKDIANLRLATRSLRQLPISLWRHLVHREMPWLWETWSKHEAPFIWATITPARLKWEVAAQKKIEEECLLYRNIIRQEIPEILDLWTSAETAFLAARPSALVEAQEAALRELNCASSYPLGKMNWYKLYTEITRHWKDLKGLQNRARIWKDIEEITMRIRRYRDEGKIVD